MHLLHSINKNNAAICNTIDYCTKRIKMLVMWIMSFVAKILFNLDIFKIIIK